MGDERLLSMVEQHKGSGFKGVTYCRDCKAGGAEPLDDEAFVGLPHLDWCRVALAAALAAARARADALERERDALREALAEQRPASGPDRSKAEQERRQRHPITTGARPLNELAVLRNQGWSWSEIAAHWGMRKLAGKRDLWWDVCRAWERSGSPGGLRKPDGYGERHNAGWAAWRAARDAAVDLWLERMLDAPAVPAGPSGTARGGEVE